MKILMISPVPTHPSIAGNRARILTLADGLTTAGHELHFAWAALEEGDRIAMRKHFDGRFIELIYRQPKTVSGFSARFRRGVLRRIGHASAHVWGVDDWYDSGLTDQLLALQTQHNFEAIFVEYVFLSKALEVFPADVVKIIDTHDRFADRHLHYLQAGKQPEWFATTQAGERKGLARADVAVAIQDSEARLFAATLPEHTRVTTVGHLLDMSQSVLMANVPRAIFIASANSINVDAANNFIVNALPLIRTDLPNFEFWLAGDVCRDALDAPGVHKIGRVDSVAHTYAQGALAVNPVCMGTGLNIKTMECLALGVPLVATESGSRGLENLRGRAFLAVPDNDAAAMAASVIRVLRDQDLRASLVQEALAAARAWNATQFANLDSVLRAPAPRITRGAVRV